MAREDEIIDRFDGNWRFLSNFSLDPVTVPGAGTHAGTFRTAEHLFQALKTLDAGEIDRIRSCKTPGEAKRVGRRVSLRPNWEDVKIEMMSAVVILKFGVGTLLAERLLNTGDALLVEGNTWGDTFWGVCDGVGENRLGKILMNRRELLAAVRREDEALAESLGQMSRGQYTVRVPRPEVE